MRERKIVIELVLPQSPRKRWLLAVIALALCVGVIGYAALPNDFTTPPGQSLSSSKMMANFNNLDGRVSTVEGAYQNASNLTTGTLAVTRGGTGIGACAGGQFLRASATNTWAAATIADSDVPSSLITRSFVTQGAFTGSGATLQPSAYSLSIGTTGVNFFSGHDNVPNGMIGFPGAGWKNGYITYYPHISNGHAAFEVTGVEFYYGDSGKPTDLYVNGAVAATSNINSSDRRLKKDITPLHDALKTLDALRAVRFRWKSNNEPSIGFIAQDVEKVYPELVSEDMHGMKGVAYANMVAIVAEAVKEEHEQLTALQAENAALRDRLGGIEKQLAALGAKGKLATR